MSTKKEDRVQLVMPRAEIERLDAFVKDYGCPSRSAVIRAAIAELLNKAHAIATEKRPYDPPQSLAEPSS